MVLTERQMFELSFQRPHDYLLRSAEEQWRIDDELGILDWKGEGLSDEDRKRLNDHYLRRFTCPACETRVTGRGKPRFCPACNHELGQ